jgi:general secretion pathway protein C
MEKYIRKYFWTVNLVTIMLCAYLLAKSFNTVAGSMLSDDPLAGINPVAPPEVSTQVSTKAPMITKSKTSIFDGSAIDPAPMAMDPTGGGEGGGDETPLPENPSDYTESTFCRKTSIAGTLVGTMAASDPLASFAMLENSDKKIVMLEVGDQVQVGITVVAIVRHKVFLDNNGTVECYKHGEDDEKTPMSKPEDATPSDEGIRKVSETEYIISRSEIQRAMENLNMLATQARIVPSFKNGVSNGFRIYSIKPGSLFQKIGMKNGDVIQRVNGADLDSPEKALSLYSQLRSEGKISMDLLRRGKPVQMDYTIQ